MMKFKALFLLITFLLNTLVGFACALYMNKESQKVEAVIDNHSHSHSTKHHSHETEQLNEGESKGHHVHSSHSHGDPSSVKTAELPKPDSSLKPNSISSKDGSCCQDDIYKFNSTVKIIPYSGKNSIKVTVLDTWLYHTSSSLAASGIYAGGKKYFIPDKERPPTLDIRIAIQSFLI